MFWSILAIIGLLMLALSAGIFGFLSLVVGVQDKHWVSFVGGCVLCVVCMCSLAGAITIGFNVMTS